MQTKNNSTDKKIKETHWYIKQSCGLVDAIEEEFQLLKAEQHKVIKKIDSITRDLRQLHEMIDYVYNKNCLMNYSENDSENDSENNLHSPTILYKKYKLKRLNNKLK